MDREHKLILMLVLFVLIAVGLSGGTLILLLNFRDLQSRQERVDYRLCVRQQVTRASIDRERNGDEPFLKLYDCRPDLYGGAAHVLSPAEATAFIRYVATTKNLP